MSARRWSAAVPPLRQALRSARLRGIVAAIAGEATGACPYADKARKIAWLEGFVATMIHSRRRAA